MGINYADFKSLAGGGGLSSLQCQVAFYCHYYYDIDRTVYLLVIFLSGLI